MDGTALPELAVAAVQRWCQQRVSLEALHQVKDECEVEPRQLTIVERRRPHGGKPPAPTGHGGRSPGCAIPRPPAPGGCYGADRGLAFRAYDHIAPTPTIADILAEIDRNPTGIFWG